MVSSEFLRTIHRIHFVGIGGSGMSPLAEILLARGYAVTGSAVNESDNVARMRSWGVPVALQQEACNVGDAELVVYTSAVSPANPELTAARERGIPLVERGRLLGLISREYAEVVAIAGTHGKTTTTSMVSQILLIAGLDPTIFIGGRLPLIGANGRAGGGSLMVCEACEFQDHYLAMKPAIAVVLNVDADHLDYFGDLDGVKASFRRFVSLATRAVIVNADDDNSLAVTQDLANAELITFGSRREDFDWVAKNSRLVGLDGRGEGAFGQYDLWNDGAFFATITLGVPGLHNIANSMAAAAAAHLCGATAAQIADGLKAFRGAGRRFEFLGTYRYVTVADDYAHHPTEIAATLGAAKNMGFQTVWAVFQPFTFTRTVRHFDGFVESLAAADRVILSDIMGSREENATGISSADIAARIPGALYLPGFEEIADYVAAGVGEGDLVLTMGGGDIYKCARLIAAKLGGE